jgi:hypothetical protein
MHPGVPSVAPPALLDGVCVHLTPLAGIDRKYHSLIRQMIEELLTYQPGRETNNWSALSLPIRRGSLLSWVPHTLASRRVAA